MIEAGVVSNDLEEVVQGDDHVESHDSVSQTQEESPEIKDTQNDSIGELHEFEASNPY